MSTAYSHTPRPLFYKKAGQIFFNWEVFVKAEVQQKISQITLYKNAPTFSLKSGQKY